ncbi:hypothetical protein FRC09_018330 [Ceratobasidium sp. 395]|nr:hypothetical protein FRC09_018330 [Ceratobasidium sp. 395]
MHFSSFVVPFIVAGSVFAAPTELTPRQASCTAQQLVFLAGTSESGLGSVGTALAKALGSSVSAYPVPYDTRAEYVTTVAAGARTTEAYIAKQAAACPSQRFILGGYSKGALVVHQINLSSALKSKVASVNVFGDPALKNGGSSAWPINSPSVDLTPKDGSTSSQNIASFCNSGDIFCDPRGNSLPAHLAYSTDGSATVAATFDKARA